MYSQIYMWKIIFKTIYTDVNCVIVFNLIYGTLKILLATIKVSTKNNCAFVIEITKSEVY